MSYIRGQKKDVCSRDCLLPKRTRKEQRSQVLEENVKRIFWEVMEEHNWKLEDFAAEDMKDEPSVSSSFYVVHGEIMKTKKKLFDESNPNVAAQIE